MRIGVPKEIHDGEMRVATSPDVATQLQKLGFSVAIEAGAGRTANFEDEAYRQAGVTVLGDAASVWSSSDIILKVRAPERHPALSPPSCLAGAEAFADVPASNAFCRWIEELARRGVASGCGS